MSRFVRAREPYCVTCLTMGRQTPTTDAGHFQYNTERSQHLGGNALWFDARNALVNAPSAIVSPPVCWSRTRSTSKEYGPNIVQELYDVDIVQELYDLWRAGKKWTREEIEAKRQSFEEGFNAVALKGLGLLRSDSGIENVAVIR